MDKRINKQRVVLEYKSLIVVGIKGMSERSLGELRDSLRENPDYEIANVKKEPNRDFLSIFSSNHPIVDLTVDQYGSGASAIVGYSLDKTRLIRGIDEVRDKFNFSLDPKLDPEFETLMTAEFELEKYAYAKYIFIAKAVRIPIENVFANVRYVNFLSRYCNESVENAQKRAALRFGLYNLI